MTEAVFDTEYAEIPPIKGMKLAREDTFTTTASLVEWRRKARGHEQATLDVGVGIVHPKGGVGIFDDWSNVAESCIIGKHG